MYVLISRLHVAHYNAQQCKDIIMPVPLHAAIMLAHALGARLGKPVQGAALILHHAAVEEEWLPNATGSGGKRLLANKRGATAFYVKRPHGGDYARGQAAPAAMSYQMHATANGCFSLVLNFDDDSVSPDSVLAQLQTMRFAGGTLQNTPEVLLFDDFDSLLMRMRSGYLVMDAKARAAQKLDEGEEPTDVFLHRHAGAYIVPAAVGYRLLTPLSTQRKGIRRSPGIDVEGHAFAETILGLIELRHVNRLKYPPLPLDDIDIDIDTPWVLEMPNETDPDDDRLDDALAEPATEEGDPLPAATCFAPDAIFWQHGWNDDQTHFLIYQP